MALAPVQRRSCLAKLNPPKKEAARRRPLDIELPMVAKRARLNRSAISRRASCKRRTVRTSNYAILDRPIAVRTGRTGRCPCSWRARSLKTQAERAPLRHRSMSLLPPCPQAAALRLRPKEVLSCALSSLPFAHENDSVDTIIGRLCRPELREVRAIHKKNILRTENKPCTVLSPR